MEKYYDAIWMLDYVIEAAQINSADIWQNAVLAISP